MMGVGFQALGPGYFSGFEKFLFVSVVYNTSGLISGRTRYSRNKSYNKKKFQEGPCSEGFASTPLIHKFEES